MKIALDIDDTITAHPNFFSEFSKSHQIVIVTSRPDSPESQKETEKLLSELEITYQAIYFCDWEMESDTDTPLELEGPERLLFQKVTACRQEQVTAIFDDDPIVRRLIKRYLPKVATLSP